MQKQPFNQKWRFHLGVFEGDRWGEVDGTNIPLFDELIHPGNTVADFHNSNDWMKARIMA